MYITKDILYRGIKWWVEETRKGTTMSQEQSDALSVEENAELATNGLWEWLLEDTYKFDK